MRISYWVASSGTNHWPSVAMGHYFSVMRVLGSEMDISQLAEDDIFGRRLQDSELITKRRAPKRKARDDT